MPFEGTLRKWTNVIQGWQYRYFVLDAHEGLLIYYTSKDTMHRGERRGVVFLREAHLGINTEDDNNFTIRSQGKLFHFQARDGDEREKWISNLEDAISLTTVNIEKFSFSNRTNFERQISQVDVYFQLLVDQVNELESIDQNRQCYKHLVTSAKKLIESVKYSAVSLQLAQRHMSSSNEIQTNLPLEKINNDEMEQEMPVSTDVNSNSDDDDDFFDPCGVNDRPDPSPSTPEERITTTAPMNQLDIPLESYEAAYEEQPEEDLAPIDGTILSHLISQARVSMDLTRITLPTFILERRSFLEMLADFLAHPDEFVNISNGSTPRDRFIQVVKWYLSAFHAGRKSPVPKKPYNPVLGETFQCYYDLGTSPNSNTLTSNGPVPWASDDQVTFLAEQTSHHPPIASFYAECPAKRIQIDGCLYTRSRFLFLSVGVNMIGNATLTVLDHDESYVITFPDAYGRNILGIPWFEMGGKVSIVCEKTGYVANIEFLTKPLFNDRKHQITGTLLGPDKKEFAKIDGEWNGVMNIRWTEAKTVEVFFDTKTTPVIKKIVRPIGEQEEYESRRLWKDVTYYLKAKEMDKATAAKTFLEQRQRQQAKERAGKSLEWKTKYFTEYGQQKWTYENPLNQRLANQS